MSVIQGPTLPLAVPRGLQGGEERLRPTDSPDAPSFGDLLSDTLSRANQSAHAASAAGQAFAAGSVDDIHGTMLALSKAEIELRYVGAVRNKIVDAFYELWRMQI